MAKAVWAGDEAWDFEDWWTRQQNLAEPVFEEDRYERVFMTGPFGDKERFVPRGLCRETMDHEAHYVGPWAGGFWCHADQSVRQNA